MAEKSLVDADVLIIGAGLAGLSTAAHLAQSDLSVLCLEARDRIGGRAWTTHVEGIPIDMGCSYLHNIYGSPLYALAKEMKLKMRTDDVEYESESHKKVAELAERLMIDEAATIDGPSPSFSADLEAYLRFEASKSLNAEEMQLLDRMMPLISNYAGAPLSDVSQRFFGSAREIFRPDLVLLSGYDSIVNRLAGNASRNSKFRLALNTPVKRLSRVGDGVRAETHSGETFWARRVVVTIPLGCLKAQDIAFDPPLTSRRQEAIENIGLAKNDRLVLVYDRDWLTVKWHAMLLFKPEAALPGLGGLDIYTFRRDSILVVAMFICPDHIEAFESLSDEAATAWAHSVISKSAFVRKDFDVPSPRRGCRSTWSSDPFSRGAYSYIRKATAPCVMPPSPLDFLELSKACWDSRLGFAGEATHEDAYSFAHGAYLTGVREARRLMLEFEKDANACNS